MTRLDTSLSPQSDLPVALICRRPFACDVGQIKGIDSVVSRSPRGALRIVRNVARGMRWPQDCAQDEMRFSCGRRSRVVLTPRRWRQLATMLWHCAGDGDKKARSPERARNKS